MHSTAPTTSASKAMSVSSGVAAAEPSFNLWIHDDRFSKTDLILNPDIFPEFKKGDVVEIVKVQDQVSTLPAKFLQDGTVSLSKCSLLDHDGNVSSASGHGYSGSDAYNEAVKPRLVVQVPDFESFKQQPNLQVSLAQHIASAFDLQSRNNVFVRKLKPDSIAADYVELSIRDQYIGRSDMWKLALFLIGCCVYPGKKLSFNSSIRAVAKEIVVSNRISGCGYVSSDTKIVFRSESAKCFLFIQVSKEMVEFNEDGDLHSEAVVRGMLPELFSIWKLIGVTHIVNILLFSRVFYPPELCKGLAFAEPESDLNVDSQMRVYQDFYKVLVDWETRSDWSTVLYTLKRELLKFQKDVILRELADGRMVSCGVLSSAQEGNLLEAVNLALNPFDKHYIDRDFSRTGLSIVVITPGPGRFEVNKNLWRLTTERMIDNGIGLDIVSSCRPPLYQVPLFQFDSEQPTGSGSLAADKHDGAEYGSSLSTSSCVGGPATSNANTVRGHYMNVTSNTASKARNIVHVPESATPKFVAANTSSSVNTQSSSLAVALNNDSNAGATSPNKLNYLSQDPLYVDDFGGSKDKSTGTQKNTFFALPNWSSCSFWSKGEKASTASLSAGSKLGSTGFVLRAKMPGIEQLSKQTRIQMSSQLTLADFEYLLSDPLASGAATKRVDAAENEDRGTTYRSASTSLAPTTRSTKQPKLSFKQRIASTTGNISNVMVAQSPSITSQTSPLPASSDQPSHQGFTNGTAVGLSVAPSSATASANSEPGEYFYGLHQLVSVNSVTNPEQRNSFESYPKSSSGWVSNQYKQSYINPCQPGKSALQSTAYYKRWLHIFTKSMSPEIPVAVVKWKAITTPALLPLTTEFFPSPDLLQHYYREYTYTVSPNEETNAYQDTSSGDQQRIESLLLELISQRLAQGFQLVVGNGVGELSSSAPSTGSATVSSTVKPMPLSAAQSETNHKPTRNRLFEEKLNNSKSRRLQVTKPYFLSMGDHVHKLFYDASGQNIEVKRYLRRTSYNRTPITYKCRLWPKDAQGGYQKRNVIFSYPSFWSYNWNYLDHLVSGYQEEMPESLRYWRTRFLLIPAEVLPSYNYLVQPHQRHEALDEEELRVAGFYKFLEALEKSRWISHEERAAVPVENAHIRKAKALKAVHLFGISLTTLDTSAFVRRELSQPLVESFLEVNNANLQTWMQPVQASLQSLPQAGGLSTSSSLATIAECLNNPAFKFPVKDREWHSRIYSRTFIGSEAVEWFIRLFADIDTREQAVQFGNVLLQNEIFKHVHEAHSFLDGYFYYYLCPVEKTKEASDSLLLRDQLSTVSSGNLSESGSKSESVASGRRSSITWFGRASNLSRLSASNAALSTPSSSEAREKDRADETNRKIVLSRRLIVDMDPSQRSSQREKAVLHYDTVYNPKTCFHFQLHWLVCSARLIEDTLQTWARVADKCGLKLVEAPVEQVKPISDDNPFQSVVLIKLALPPPSANPRYYEIEFLKAQGFVLDVESDSCFKNLPVEHSYPVSSYKNTQLVHNTGVAFIQVLEQGGGFLWTNNRLVLTGLSSLSMNVGGIAASPNVTATTAASVKFPMANSVTLNSAKGASSSALEEATPPPLLSSVSSQAFPKLQSNKFLAPATSVSGSINAHPDTLRHGFQQACQDVEGLRAFYDSLEQASLPGSPLQASQQSS